MNLRESYFIIPPNKNSDIKETASQLIKLQYFRTHRQLPAACSTVIRLLRYYVYLSLRTTNSSPLLYGKSRACIFKKSFFV
jgi:hypothetical protein